MIEKIPMYKKILFIAGLSFLFAFEQESIPVQKSFITFVGVKFNLVQNGNAPKRYLWIHGDEKTAKMALENHIKNYQGTAFFIQNEEREIPFENTIIVSLTEFGRTVDQNGGSGTEHGYGSAILMAGGLLSKSKVITDWPGLKKNNLFEGRDLNSSIDARAVYASILARVLDSDHKHIVNNTFFGANLPDMTKRIFS